jgi:hypothetical protein
MSKIKLHNVYYNGQSGAFEARVDIRRGDHTFRYPCQVSAPKTMDMEQVCQQLTEQAINMSDSGSIYLSRF